MEQEKMNLTRDEKLWLSIAAACLVAGAVLFWLIFTV